MNKLNLNRIESYEYLTPKTVARLNRESAHIQITNNGLNNRAKRIQEILKKLVKEENK